MKRRTRVIHSQDGFVDLMLAFFVSLLCAEDPRVRDMGILLMTATKEGPVVTAVEKLLTDAGIQAGQVEVPPLPGRPTYRAIDLDEMEKLPHDWNRMSRLEKCCVAVHLMILHFRDKCRESAQILILVAGEKDAYKVTDESGRASFTDCLNT